MSESITRLIESNCAYRTKLAALPFEEKTKLLERVRRRTVAVQTAR